MLVLGDVYRGRDNNLNLIRMLAAVAVLVSHAWPISLGSEFIQPLQAMTGHTLGALAVYVFFAVSGFLIAASFDGRRSLGSFISARGLRLIPGLAVSLALVGFVMGPLVTELPLVAYLGDPRTWQAFARNVTLLYPQYTLPGVFESNPYPTVQGSIWTLIHEVLCYGGIVMAGLLGALRRPWVAAILLLLYGAVWIAPQLGVLTLPAKAEALRNLSLPFALGTAFYVWRDRLPLSPWFALGFAILAIPLRGTPAWDFALILALVYGTLWLGYGPSGAIRAYNRVGDYSYGLYLYAFPLQGLAVWLAGPQSPAANIALALPMTFACAVLSWHLVERPALRLRARSASDKSLRDPKSNTKIPV